MKTMMKAPADPATHGREQRLRASRLSKEQGLEIIERFALLGMLVLVFVFFSVWPKTSGLFLTSANLDNVLGQQAVGGILALAVIVPLTCGKFDFAVGPIAGLTQIIVAGLMAHAGFSPIAAIFVVVALGALIGLLSGDVIARIGVNSLIVTIGLSGVIAGVVQWYSEGQAIVSGISATLVDVGTTSILGVPSALYVLVVLALLVHFLLEHTPYGRSLRSIGSNADAARLVGINVKRTTLISFVLSGTLAGLAGVLLVATYGSANPGLGTLSNSLQALAAAYLGATSIRPGRFNVPGTLIAIYLLAFSINGLSLAGVQGWVNNLFNGLALFIAVIVSTVIAKRRLV